MNAILYALATEKAVGGIEGENKMTFIVSRDASKQSIKKEVEAKYGEKVKRVTTLYTPDGRKKAIVRFARPGAASDLAARLKII